MRSNGGVMTPEFATQCPVAMMVGGRSAASSHPRRWGLGLGFKNVISFDMGGHHRQGDLVRTASPLWLPVIMWAAMRRHPVMLPMIDVVESGRRRFDRLDRPYGRPQWSASLPPRRADRAGSAPALCGAPLSARYVVDPGVEPPPAPTSTTSIIGA